jgi:hypothetical protein
MGAESNNAHQSEVPSRTVFLVNAVDNPDAGMSDSSFVHEWSWIKAPSDWTPQQGIGGGVSPVAAIIVFSKKYEEREIRKLCEAIRGIPRLDQIPLLVAVNQYEMPLANRVKKLPNASFIFTPVKEEDLVERLNRLG